MSGAVASNAQYRLYSAQAHNKYQMAQHDSTYHPGVSNWQDAKCICLADIDLKQMNINDHFNGCNLGKTQFGTNVSKFTEQVTPAICMRCLKSNDAVALDMWGKVASYIEK